ncbi:hypothetical protein BDK51DRAFT_28692, partial [Blyttiomyces helicus]
STIKYEKTAVHQDGDYDAEWAWFLYMKKLNRTRERGDRKTLSNVILTDRISVSIALQESIYSFPPKKSLPTYKEIQDKDGWVIDPSRRAIGARIDKLNPRRKKKTPKTIENSRKPSTSRAPAPDIPNDDDSCEYPCDQNNREILAVGPEGKRPLFLDTFAADKLPIAARKLTVLKKRWGNKELESSLLERASTYPAAVARLKHFRAYHLQQKALSKMVNSLIPTGLTADDVYVAYGAASFPLRVPGPLRPSTLASNTQSALEESPFIPLKSQGRHSQMQVKRLWPAVPKPGFRKGHLGWVGVPCVNQIVISVMTRDALTRELNVRFGQSQEDCGDAFPLHDGGIAHGRSAAVESRKSHQEMAYEVGGELFKRLPPPPTKLFANVLNSYPSDPLLFSEMIQNSDDAGAKLQFFCLDTRPFPTDKVLHPRLKTFNEGPHLVAFNDEAFKPKDFVSLLSVGNSQKQEEAESIGKFGLGYHMCDELAFLSGDHLAVLDPHARIISDEGRKFHIVHEGIDALATDQLAPFHAYDSILGLLKWNGESVPWTLFRDRSPSYRLRATPAQAESSENSKEIYGERLIPRNPSIKHMRPKITFCVWNENESAPRKLFSTCIVNAGDFNGSVIRASLCETLALAEAQLIAENPELVALFPERSGFTPSTEFEPSVDYELQIEQCDSCYPIIGIAFRTSNDLETARLFGYLPQPIETSLPVHFYAHISVSDNRRALVQDEDVAGVNSKGLAGKPRAAFYAENTYRLWALDAARNPRRAWASLLSDSLERVAKPGVKLFRTISGVWISASDAMFEDCDFECHAAISRVLAAQSDSLAARLIVDVPIALVRELKIRKMGTHMTPAFARDERCGDRIPAGLNLLATTDSKLRPFPSPRDPPVYLIDISTLHIILPGARFRFVIESGLPDQIARAVHNATQSPILGLVPLRDRPVAGLAVILEMARKELTIDHESDTAPLPNAGAINSTWLQRLWGVIADLRLSKESIGDSPLEHLLLIPLRNGRLGRFSRSRKVVLPRTAQRERNLICNYFARIGSTMTSEDCGFLPLHLLDDYVSSIDDVAALCDIRPFDSLRRKIYAANMTLNERGLIRSHLATSFRKKEEPSAVLSKVLALLPLVDAAETHLLPKWDARVTIFQTSPFAFIRPESTEEDDLFGRILRYQRTTWAAYYTDHVIPHLPNRPYIVDEVVDEMFGALKTERSLDSAMRARLAELPFVETHSGSRERPFFLVDPSVTAFALLFEDEPARMDSHGKMGTGKVLLLHADIPWKVVRKLKIPKCEPGPFPDHLQIRQIVRAEERVPGPAQKRPCRLRRRPCDPPQLIANADDAGARTLKINVDPTLKTPRKVPEELKPFLSGPALLVCNDSKFRFRRHPKSGPGRKRAEKRECSIGKFGLGFNVAYHLSDVVIILSGRKIPFLDPLGHLGPSSDSGAVVDHVEDKLFKVYPVIEQIFSVLPGFKSGRPYAGTCILLPLRSKPSDISTTTPSAAEILTLVKNWKEEASRTLLFIQNVEDISASRVNVTESHQNIPIFSHALVSPSKDAWIELRKKRKHSQDSVARDQELGDSDHVQGSLLQIVYSIDVATEIPGRETVTWQWILATRYQTTAASRKLELPDMSEKKLFAHVGVAALTAEIGGGAHPRLPPKADGELFSFLPLPDLGSDVPFDINGNYLFDLCSSRTALNHQSNESGLGTGARSLELVK